MIVCIFTLGVNHSDDCMYIIPTYLPFFFTETHNIFQVPHVTPILNIKLIETLFALFVSAGPTLKAGEG